MRFRKHKNCRSTCVEILKSFYIEKGDRLSLKLCWYKWSPTKGVLYPLGYTHRIKVSRKEWNANWQIIN